MSLKRVFVLVIASFAVSLTSYFIFNRFVLKKGIGSAALAVNSTAGTLTVTADGEILGKTPYYSDTLKEGDTSLILSNDVSTYRSKISLGRGTLTVVNYSLGPSEDFSEGETVWLEPSKENGSLVAISDPDGAEVRLDDALLGTTPLSAKKIASGDHTLKISKSGYRPRFTKIQNQSGYSLNIKTRLFLLPISAGAGKLNFDEEPRFKITDFSSSNPALYADTSAWAKGISFYLLSPDRDREVPVIAYDAFLDYRGQLFDKDGVKNSSSVVENKEDIKIGYLGKTLDAGLSDDAKQALKDFAAKILPKVEKVQVVGNAWANVRAEPTTSAAIVIKVNEGDKFNLISEEGSYYKISLPDGKQGYISKKYARKL